MGRKWQEVPVTLPDGRMVGYSILKRADTSAYMVNFDNLNGGTVRKSTGHTSMTEAAKIAPEIIRRHFQPELLKRSNQTWDDVLHTLEGKLTKNNNRHATYRDYASSISVLRATITTRGPGDITEAKASLFADKFISTPYSRGGEATYTRSHTTLNAYIRKFRSLWSKWLKFRDNPWKLIDFAEVDSKDPTIPTEDTVTHFMEWVKAKYPGWGLPSLFLEVKAVMGCRLKDLTEARRENLQNGVLTLDPATMKARNFRRIAIGPDLTKRLEAMVKGWSSGFLWSNYSLELKRHLEATKQRSHLTHEFFEPSAIYWFIQDLFREYNRCHTPKINSHDFRRRAVTLSFKAGLTLDEVALMFGLDRLTATRYYMAWQEVSTDDLHARVRDHLTPKPKTASDAKTGGLADTLAS
ncbi:MAG TPA: hypothetical protein VHR66_24365 [Gemmataceae bacterium]|nr:hypothetical protein [Gemmataceae bacterium]